MHDKSFSHGSTESEDFQSMAISLATSQVSFDRETPGARKDFKLMSGLHFSVLLDGF